MLADVPCTGDGATRKIPKKYLDWNTRDAYSLFPLQLSILMRAIQMCKEGGVVLYSTCSISPIEDEAVVTEAIRRALPNTLELLDCHSRLPNFKGRKGMTSWPILCSKLTKKNMTTSSVEDLKKLTFDEMFKVCELEELGTFQNSLTRGDHQYSMLKSSMFPESEEVMKKIGIEKTMRVLPHDQNTGGFYVALIKKKARTVFVSG